MTRRPDERTRQQRETNRADRDNDELHRAMANVAEWNGSTSQAIRSVYLTEVRRGTGCKVLT